MLQLLGYPIAEYNSYSGVNTTTNATGAGAVAVAGTCTDTGTISLKITKNKNKKIKKPTAVSDPASDPKFESILKELIGGLQLLQSAQVKVIVDDIIQAFPSTPTLTDINTTNTNNTIHTVSTRVASILHTHVSTKDTTLNHAFLYKEEKLL